MTSITIIPPDNRVAIDGVWRTVDLTGLGHEDLAHINAARLVGRLATVEHREHDGYWPSPRTLSEDDFKAEFHDIIAAWANAKTDETSTPSAMTATDYLFLIEEGAERARLTRITGGVGMALTYQEKKDQAVAVLGQPADAELVPEDYPVLAASVGIEADTLRQVAALVMERYETFVEISGAIERVRLSAKKAIHDAATVEDAKAICEAVTWP